MKRTIKGIRADLGLKQEEMAKILGISVVAYNKKEKGIISLKANELVKICKLANIKDVTEIELP